MKNIEINIGDKVITAYGEVGKVVDICHCDRCKERGFFEPTIEFDYGRKDYITIYDYMDEFSDYYQIGETVLGNLYDSEDYIRNQEKRIQQLQNEIKKIKKRVALIKKLSGKTTP